MLKAERHKYILAKISEEQKANTLCLAEALNISNDTIRRDLNELDRKGLISKVYGGAFPIKTESENIFDISIFNENKKNIIAKKAASLLTSGQVIIISGGTTNLAFAKMIPHNLIATIYTYSLPIAMQLSQHPNIELIFIGGKLQKKAMVTIGIDVIKVLSKIKADICFMGTSGINTDLGLTEKGYEISMVKKAMIKASDKVVAMVTSEKLETKKPHLVCEVGELKTIITNLHRDDPKLATYRSAGVQIL
jgi:DeoR/GlpR family transcriptional regulator of sugar metabolism